MPSGKNEGIELLRNIPAFCEYAERQMDANPNVWRREAQSGVGTMGMVAVAICEIGGGQP